MQNLIESLDCLGSPRVALVGDFILDRYVFGDVERINPEAPVPVLHVEREQGSAGGAGNVAAAVPALGARVACVGLVGTDAAGRELAELLKVAGADAAGLLACAARPTAVKTRYIGLAQHRSAQQMLRVDHEKTAPLGDDVQAQLLAAARHAAAAADIVVLEDYNKGVLDDCLAPQIIAAARALGKPVVVDPALLTDYSRYRGATILKPNRYEAAVASGMTITTDADLSEAARRLCEAADAEAIVITLDREGAFLFRRGEQAGRRIPHQCPRDVYDVTGAGDETVAVLAVALAAGFSPTNAVELANVAGGLEVERVGFAPITRDELACELRRMLGLRGGKVMDRGMLAAELERRRRRGDVVVFTNGCFDLLHMGHVRYLQQARELGSCLVVAINSDVSVQRLKGPTRPVIGEAERAAMLGALECVDYVTIFDEDTPIALLELLRPHMLIKGGTTAKVVGQELVEGYGGQVMTLPAVAGLSTTKIIERITGNGGAA